MRWVALFLAAWIVVGVAYVIYLLAELARDRRRAARDRHPSSGHIGPPEEWL